MVDGRTAVGWRIIVRLKKRDVERLLEDYDADPIVALTAAMRTLVDLPHATWAELLAIAPIDDERRQRLLAGDESSLDQLAAELNEFRSLQ